MDRRIQKEKKVNSSSPVKEGEFQSFCQEFLTKDKHLWPFVRPVLTQSPKTHSHPITGLQTRLTSRCYETNGGQFLLFFFFSYCEVSKSVQRDCCGFIVCCGHLEAAAWTNEAGERAGMPLRHKRQNTAAQQFLFQKIMHFFSPAPLILSDVIHHPTCEQKKKEEKKATWGLEADLR